MTKRVRDDFVLGLNTFFTRANRQKSKREAHRPARRRPTLELLEDRSLLATLTVNNLTDAVLPGSGQVTLRQAIVASENHTTTALGDTGTGNDTIVFAPGLAGTIDLSQIGDSSMGPTALVVNANDQLTINGNNGASGITIARDSSVANLRLVIVESGASLTLESLTLANGDSTGAAGGNTRDDGGSIGGGGGGGGGAGLGGAVFNQGGSLNLVQDTLTGNVAAGGTGGSTNFIPTGFHVNGGTGGGPNGGAGGFGGPLFGLNGAVGGFASGGGGGGWSDIHSGSGGAGGFGGGGGGAGAIDVVGGTLGLGAGGGFGGGAGTTGENVSPYDGGAGGGGAGMGGAVFNDAGTVKITNSTLAGNSATGGAAGGSGATAGQGIGGALFNYNGTINVLNSTIAANSADASAGGIYNLGDGQTASLALNNTIVAGNLVDTTEADFTGGTTAAGGSTNSTSGVGNLIVQQTGFTGTIVSTQDPGLAALAANGGPTETMAIDATSPAYHAGNAAAAAGLISDQRGAPRFSTGNLIDIGAYQSNPAPSAEAGGPYLINVGDSLHLDASASTDPDGDTLTYSWDINGDGTFGDATGVSPTLTWSQLNALGINGPFSTANLRVEVSDGVNQPVVSSTTSLNVVNDASPTQGAGTAIAGNELAPLTSVAVGTFAASAGLPSPSQFSAAIDWGDGTPASPGTIALSGNLYTVTGSHTYADEGRYAVDVTVAGSGAGSIVIASTALVHEELLAGGIAGTANQRFVSELYADLFHRQVDASGLAHWTAMLDAGTTRAQVALDVEQSTEYLAGEVQAAFQQFLHRSADPTALAYFVNRLAAGVTIEQVQQSLLMSAEYFQNRGGGTNDGFLDALYHDLLARAVDGPTRSLFDAISNTAASRAAVVSYVYGSLEYQRDVVRGLFEQYLDRPADAAGMNADIGWLQVGLSLPDVALQLLGSPEYLDKANV